MHRFAYIGAQTPAAAAAVLANTPNAVLKAGGVDLLDLLKEHLISPAVIVDISQIQDLCGVAIDSTSGALRIGALTTFAQIATQPDAQQGWPALTQAAASAATPQIRHLATIGGNLCQRPRCWYFRQED